MGGTLNKGPPLKRPTSLPCTLGGIVIPCPCLHCRFCQMYPCNDTMTEFSCAVRNIANPRYIYILHNVQCKQGHGMTIPLGVNARMLLVKSCSRSLNHVLTQIKVQCISSASKKRQVFRVVAHMTYNFLLDNFIHIHSQIQKT